MKFHSHEELISDLESIQEVATDQFAEIFCLTDDVSIPWIIDDEWFLT